MKIEASSLTLTGIRHAFFTRAGGVSSGLYATLNGGVGSQDHAGKVVENRARMAAALGVTNVRAVSTRAADFLRRYAQAAPDLVVLDPPRAGADGETLRRLAEIGPGHIHYASCQPPTLARDLAFLVGHGYRLQSVELFDLFPQTFHIEALAKLSRA